MGVVVAVERGIFPTDWIPAESFPVGLFQVVIIVSLMRLLYSNWHHNPSTESSQNLARRIQAARYNNKIMRSSGNLSSSLHNKIELMIRYLLKTTRRLYLL